MTRAAIHPTAIVETGADLADNVCVGAYAYVGSDVKIGSGCDIRHHACVDGWTEMGEHNTVYPYACVGFQTQDLKFRGGRPGLKIGDRNVFREFCTVHTATGDGDRTIIGSHNCILAYAHVGHDSVVGNHCILSNNGTLAGHVRMEDHVIISGLAGVHQFCRLGVHAFIGGCSKVVQDVPPYMIADGNPAAVRTVNKVGLERNGFTPEQLRIVRLAYRILYRDGLNHSQALARLEALPEAGDPILRRLIAFVRDSGRGVA